ncbi:hypothetical protein PRUPE_2G188800 [Prunus persica]|uniref:Uncharacterized protein n=1 Tax=Prunus persica TaxID=3760 RepID=M5X6G7_PRUPE|nr:hypothetical protein PRUPE_2G188800 [Prunus persica]
MFLTAIKINGNNKCSIVVKIQPLTPPLRISQAATRVFSLSLLVHLSCCLSKLQTLAAIRQILIEHPSLLQFLVRIEIFVDNFLLFFFFGFLAMVL